MKKFIVDSGKVLIDVCAWIILIALIISSFVLFFTEPMGGFLLFLLGMVAFISLFYLLYLFIDTNETLHQILENQTNEQKNDNTNT